MRSVSDSIVNIEANNQELSFEQPKVPYAGNNLTLRENTFEQNLNFLTRYETYNLSGIFVIDLFSQEKSDDTCKQQKNDCNNC